MIGQPGDEPVVRVTGVHKRFGGTHALRGVSLDLRAETVQVLLGENGAGKSTLISVLTGLGQADSGQIFLEGAPAHLRSPRDALRAGIVAVLQRSSLVAELSIRDNFRLSGLTSDADLSRAKDILHSLYGAPSSFETRVGALDLGVRHLVEITRAIVRNPRVLILDEPTALLSSHSAKQLIELVRDLKSDGVAVMFVTHKLDEALMVADELAVMRHGQITLIKTAADIHHAAPESLKPELLRAMFGSDVAGTIPDEARPKPGFAAEPLLQLNNITTPSSADECGLSEVTLTVHAGEIVGIAGISGNGQSHLARVIEGSVRPRHGTVTLRGADVTRLDIHDRMRRGLQCVTDDRFGEGLVGQLSVGVNLLLQRIGATPFWRFGLTNRDRIHEHARSVISSAHIAAESPEAAVDSLSGGNAQKLLLARAVSANAAVTVLHQPTHGLDARTVVDVRGNIRRSADAGMAVLVISSDLDEVVQLSDHVFVLDQGRVVAKIVGHTPSTRADIAQAISGAQS